MDDPKNRDLRDEDVRQHQVGGGSMDGEIDSLELGETIPSLETVSSRVSREGSTAPTRPASRGEDILVAERYLDRGQVGRGGMGTVRCVLDTQLMRECAVKLIHRDLATKENRVTRFTEEAQITGQLDHPYIVPIHELGKDQEGHQYFSMKLVQGQTLSRLLKRAGAGRLEPEQLADFLGIFLKVCDAVSFAHSRGVIHRDIKPSNIMVGEFGQVYLMDWGVARLMRESRPDQPPLPHHVQVTRDITQTTMDLPGSIVGTPRYMSPEQVEGMHDNVDVRSDVFSLGATLYQILSGRPPYQAEKLLQLLYDVQTCNFESPDKVTTDGRIPGELTRITMKAMAPEPAKRYAAVTELSRDVERFLRGSWHQPTRKYPAGSLIVKEGEEGHEAFIIVDGCCVAFDDSGDERVVLREMGPGEVFGETAVFSAGPRTASVEAKDDVSVIVVTRETLTDGLGLNSWMGSFVKALAERFSDVDQRLRRLERDRLESSRP